MSENPAKVDTEIAPDAAQIVADALRGLRFGTVKLIVQDGLLIRVERTENRQVARRLAAR